jgi:hypothetical protein
MKDIARALLAKRRARPLQVYSLAALREHVCVQHRIAGAISPSAKTAIRIRIRDGRWRTIWRAMGFTKPGFWIANGGVGE